MRKSSLCVHRVWRWLKLTRDGPPRAQFGHSLEVRGFTLNAKDFGLVWNAQLEPAGFLVGDDVEVSLSIQVMRVSASEGYSVKSAQARTQ
jgi:hypothetical protein